jgi:hypothetical protein
MIGFFEADGDWFLTEDVDPGLGAGDDQLLMRRVRGADQGSVELTAREEIID